ncbi:MAG: response regulator transcription factor [Clostridia bacterium]|nr:response regulator transcription factor [Clostridia bacterium]
MAKILVVDDEQHIVELVKFNLEKEGYQVVCAHDGATAIKKFQEENPDLMVLDIMLPEMDGLEVCRRLRSLPNGSDVPVIMLTAKGEEVDKVLGLEIGADDYMTKPFSPRELVARVKARLRRLVKEEKQSGDGQVLTYGDLVVYPENYEVMVKGRKQDLTPKEFELLKLLLTNRGKVFTRDYLLERIWGYDYYGDTRTVDVHIRHLRQKIEEEPGNPIYIETVRGVGYRFKS